MPKAKKPVLPMEGEDVKRTELGGYYRRIDYREFWNATEELLRQDGIQNEPTIVFAKYMMWLKAKIIAKVHELDPSATDANGYPDRRNEHQLNSLLNAIRPGWNQFIEMYLEVHEPPPKTEQTGIDEGNVAARARARGRNSLENDDVKALSLHMETPEMAFSDKLLREAYDEQKRHPEQTIGEIIRRLGKGDRA